MADTKMLVLFSIFLSYILQSSVAVPLQKTEGEVKACPNCKNTGDSFNIVADHKGLKHKAEIQKPHLLVSDMKNDTTQVFDHSEMKYDTGVYSTICWTKILTVTKNLVTNTTEQTTEYAVSFESPADIPAPYRKPTDDSDGILGTKVSYPWPFETLTTDGFISVKKTREVTCASGPMYIKESKNWPSTGKQRVEIRVMPKNGTLSKCDESNPSKERPNPRSDFFEKFKMSSSMDESFAKSMNNKQFGESFQQTPFGFTKMTSMSSSSASSKVHKKSSKSISRLKSRQRFLDDDDTVESSPDNRTSKNHSSEGNPKVHDSAVAHPGSSSSKTYRYEISLPRNRKFNLTALLSGSYSKKYRRPIMMQKNLKYTYGIDHGDDEYNNNVDDSMDTLSKLGKKYKWHKKLVITPESAPHEEHSKSVTSKLIKSPDLLQALEPLFEEAEIDGDSMDDFLHLLKKLASLKKSKKPRKGNYKKVAKITYNYNPRPDINKLFNSKPDVVLINGKRVDPDFDISQIPGLNLSTEPFRQQINKQKPSSVHHSSEIPPPQTKSVKVVSHTKPVTEVTVKEQTTQHVSASTESTPITTESQTFAKVSEDLITRRTEIATDYPKPVESSTQKREETPQYSDHSHPISNVEKHTSPFPIPISEIKEFLKKLEEHPHVEETTTVLSVDKTSPSTVNSLKKETIQPLATEVKPVNAVTEISYSTVHSSSVPQVSETLPINPVTESSNVPSSDSQTVPENKPVNNEPQVSENTSTVGLQTEQPVNSVTPEDKPEREQTVSPHVNDSPVKNTNQPEKPNPQVTESPVQNQDVPTVVPSEQPEQPKNEVRVPKVTDSPVQNQDVPKENTVVPNEQPEQPKNEVRVPEVTDSPVQNPKVPKENTIVPSEQPEQPKNEVKVPEVTDSPIQNPEVPKENTVVPSEQPKNEVTGGPVTTEVASKDVNVPSEEPKKYVNKKIDAVPETPVTKQDGPIENIGVPTGQPEQHNIETKVPEVTDSPVSKQDVPTENKVAPTEQPEQPTNKMNVPEATDSPAAKQEVVPTEKPEQQPNNEVKVPEVSDSPVTKQDVVTDNKVHPSEQPKQNSGNENVVPVSEVPVTKQEMTTQAAVSTTSVGHPKPQNKSNVIAIRRDDNTLECYQLGDMSFRKKCPEDMSNVPIYSTTNHGVDAVPTFEVDNMDEFIKLLCSKKMQRYLKSKRRPDSALDRYFRKKLTPTVLPSKHVMHEKRNHDKAAITHHKTE